METSKSWSFGNSAIRFILPLHALIIIHTINIPKYFIVFVLLKVGSLNVERCPALLRPSLCARPSLPSVVDGLSLFRSVCYHAPLLRAPYGLTTYCFDASLHGYQSSVEAVYLVTGWSLCLGLQL